MKRTDDSLKIKYFRMKLSLSQHQLAESSRLDLSTIQSIEYGHRGITSAEAEALKNAFSERAGELFATLREVETFLNSHQSMDRPKDGQQHSSQSQDIHPYVITNDE